jgi:pimeloyl-ACP methyl ester carboxylesterase
VDRNVTGLFVPGWGATVRLYAAGLPEGWEGLELPSFRQTRGELGAYRTWLAGEIVQRGGPVAVAGHSMGGALGLLVAVDRPELVESLILVSPAGLPLTKPILSSLVTFARQVATGRYPLTQLGRVLRRVAVAPRSAVRLGRTVHGLDLRPEVDRFRANPVPCTVVGCTTDTLTPASHCRRLAALLGAGYGEVDAPDGHIWPITHPRLLAAALTSAARP